MNQILIDLFVCFLNLYTGKPRKHTCKLEIPQDCGGRDWEQEPTWLKEESLSEQLSVQQLPLVSFSIFLCLSSLRVSSSSNLLIIDSTTTIMMVFRECIMSLYLQIQWTLNKRPRHSSTLSFFYEKENSFRA